MFEGYPGRSAEANRKGRDASHALCICRFGIDALPAIAVRAGLTVHLQVTRSYRQ